MESERGGDVRYQMFHCHAGPDIGPVSSPPLLAAASPCCRAVAPLSPRLCALWWLQWRANRCCPCAKANPPVFAPRVASMCLLEDACCA